uniref:Peptidase S1 domain-containing protein n=1 Tax=Daphnia galeata TaxID=27404 RepID=A0A8J2RT35_9CRUS|nr:unnamed protein product [Daphnia galeata]
MSLDSAYSYFKEELSDINMFENRRLNIIANNNQLLEEAQEMKKAHLTNIVIALVCLDGFVHCESYSPLIHDSNLGAGVPNVKIMGGSTVDLATKPAVAGEFPSMALLRLVNGNICGGTLIGPSHVLTAAHCLAETCKPGKPGCFSIEPLEPFVRGYSTYYLSPAIITGWGRTSSGGYLNVLLKTNVTINNNSLCDNYIDIPEPIAADKICSIGPPAIRFLQGDGGGPIFVNGVQVGIISVGYTNFRGLSRNGPPPPPPSLLPESTHVSLPISDGLPPPKPTNLHQQLAKTFHYYKYLIDFYSNQTTSKTHLIPYKQPDSYPILQTSLYLDV